ncbi:protein CNPPD1 [Phlebotomus papatasi]|uniref:protein CNPPD1 n=1 Tax=Phlebotomus papatasi TaxID=29031 RepID=UPI002483B43A|nr:protein CNPPD1 [Phlebotomus papatasi]
MTKISSQKSRMRKRVSVKNLNVPINPSDILSCEEKHQDLMYRIQKSLYYGGFQMLPELENISGPLCDLAAGIFSSCHRGYSLQRLNAVTVGKIRSTPFPLIMSLVYLDLLQELDPTFVQSVTPTELFVCVMLIATKFYCGYDEEICLSHWAKYAKVTVERLKKMELELLKALDWRIYISHETFFRKLCLIENLLAQQQGFRRGWFTYTELTLLMPSNVLSLEIISLTSILALCYVVALAAIASAFLVVHHIPGTIFYHHTYPGITDTLSAPSHCLPMLDFIATRCIPCDQAVVEKAAYSLFLHES